MTNFTLCRKLGISISHSIFSQRCYHVGRASSVNTAILRGLRKSKGMGFRGKAITNPKDPREIYRNQHGIDAYKPHPNSKHRDVDTSHGLKSSARSRDLHKTSTGDVSNEPAFPQKIGRFGEIIQGRPRRIKVSGHLPRYGRTHQSNRAGLVSQSRVHQVNTGSSELPSSQGRFRSSHNKLEGNKFSPSSSTQTTAWDSFGKYGGGSSRSQGKYPTGDESLSFESESFPTRFSKNGRKQTGFSRNSSSKGSAGSQDQSLIDFRDKSSVSQEHNTDEVSKSKLRISHAVDNRVPISIPYTTAQSEFLYGTSVVEAALSSQRETRRKLYKLYVYSEAEREDPRRDDHIIRLAQKRRVEVVHLGSHSRNLMDKMSGGRPHNGYVLEASPLPRLPVSSLGEVKNKDNQHGFEVFVDHQSREEAAVNGADNFITLPRISRGRNPLVLLLDSIVDPGNLGSIIRTAAFLGVSAIAISSRNSASFTSIVLKASAGASENMTLFTVKTPAGFIVDSQAKGWKVFAAVAPLKNPKPQTISISTDDLGDPLAESPCLLMLGSEGEGLRWNLRSKADVELYIQGCGQSYNVDSLNVSVATGILCNSFVGGKKATKPPANLPALDPVPQAEGDRLF